MQVRLAGLPFVKDVHPEQRMTRGLAWEEEAECREASGGLCEARQRIVKRPGRHAPPEITVFYLLCCDNLLVDLLAIPGVECPSA